MPEALTAALADLFTARALKLVLLPLFCALMMWLLLYALFWHSLIAGVHELIAWAQQEQWLGDSVANFLGASIVLAVMLLAIAPLTIATALLITATIALPLLLDPIAHRDYPQLERRHGGTMLGGIINAVIVSLIYLGLWLLSLPLWLFGGIGAIAALLLGAWLNARMFCYDALAEHASREEFARFMTEQRAPLFGLGLVATLLQTIPVVNLIAPVYAALVFIHFGLAQLRIMRQRTPVPLQIPS